MKTRLTLTINGVTRMSSNLNGFVGVEFGVNGVVQYVDKVSPHKALVETNVGKFDAYLGSEDE